MINHSPDHIVTGIVASHEKPHGFRVLKSTGTFLFYKMKKWCKSVHFLINHVLIIKIP